MAIHTDNAVSGQQGFAKVMDSKSTAILLDLTQENQYQYPVQSTIRELVSNAVDSTTEKLRALSILSGEKTVADYYVEKEGEMYEDSKFNPSYYNPAFLQVEEKNVRIEIEQRGQEYQRDILRVMDQGVGLWGSRLELYFSIGGSTKRLDSQTLGKFGLGAKAPLSMDVASFRMTTTYNGMRTAFDIYNRKIEPVYGKWDANEKLRDSFTFSNGVVVYYDQVEAPNGVSVEVEVKKAWRKELLNSIKHQLLFFTSVQLFVKQEWSDQFVQQEFLASVLYEDEYIILSDNNQFSKPHLVLDNGNTKVCYGAILFDQLELEAKQGNIGLKIRAEDVDIVPSREYVKWGSKTREIVLQRFREAQQIATELVQKELQETDPLLWLEKAAAIQNNLGGNGSVLARLSRIVDKNGIVPTYPGTDIKFGDVNVLFAGCKLRRVYENYKKDVERPEVYSWSQVHFDAFYVTRGSASKAKDVQLARQHQEFTLLTLPEAPVQQLGVDPALVPEEQQKQLAAQQAATVVAQAAYEKKMEFINWLLQSKQVLDYDSVVVEAAIEQELLEVEKAAAEQAVADDWELTPAQVRKLNGKVFVKFIRSYADNSQHLSEEPTLKEVQSWTMPIIYGTQEEKEQLFFLGQMLWKQFKTGQSYRYSEADYNAEFKILQASREVIKKLPSHAIPVASFFYPVSPTTLDLHPMLRPWYTSLQVESFLRTVPFLNNFSLFNQQMHELYKELQQYVSKHKVDLSGYGTHATMYKELLETSNKMATFEQFTKDHSTDSEAIAAKSTELFGVNTVTGSHVWDTDIQAKLETLQLYCQPLVPFFNQISCLTSTYAQPIDGEVEQGIRELLTLRGAQQN